MRHNALRAAEGAGGYEARHARRVAAEGPVVAALPPPNTAARPYIRRRRRCTWRSSYAELRAADMAEAADDLRGDDWIELSEEGQRAMVEGLGMRTRRVGGVWRVYLNGVSVEELGRALGYA